MFVLVLIFYTDGLTQRNYYTIIFTLKNQVKLLRCKLTERFYKIKLLVNNTLNYEIVTYSSLIELLIPDGERTALNALKYLL